MLVRTVSIARLVGAAKRAINHVDHSMHNVSFVCRNNVQARLASRTFHRTSASKTVVNNAAAAELRNAAPTASKEQNQKQRVKQVVDYTTLVACVAEINSSWVPAKVEQVRCQSDAWAVSMHGGPSWGYD